MALANQPAATPASPQDAARLQGGMLQLLMGIWVGHAVSAFARVGIADVMEGGADTADAIAEALGLRPDRVFRLLRAVATVGIVTQAGEGRFRLTPLGRTLGSHGAVGMRTAAELFGESHGTTWQALAGALASDGTAFEATAGQPFFAWLNERPAEAARFQRLMVEVHGPETPAIVGTYDFSNASHIVDVGGGNGSLLSAVLALFPGRRATLLDLPGGIAAARAGEGGPLPGVALVAGDFFAAVPPGGDCYLLRHIVHDWSDEDALRILRNVRAAAAPGAQVLILESPLPEGDVFAPGKWLDLHMMLLVGGRERTQAQYEALMSAAGLTRFRMIPTPHPAMAIFEATVPEA
jgi:C-methyltransferase